jgi:hypothetical protein
MEISITRVKQPEVSINCNNSLQKGGRYMKLFRIVFSIMMALVIYGALGGCSDEKMVERCKSGDMLPVGEYLLVNNLRGYCMPGGHNCYFPYSQCIFVDQRENTYGWTWAETPENSGEWTSAYVHYGDKLLIPLEWGSTTPALPVSIVDTTSITIDYDVLVSTTSEHRLSIIAGYYWSWYKRYFSESIVIEVDSASSISPENFQKRVMIDGEEYDYYYEEIPSLGLIIGVKIIHSFVKIVPTPTGTLRLHKFLDVLPDDGYGVIEQIDYIRFSQTMRGGAGSTTIRNFSVEIK